MNTNAGGFFSAIWGQTSLPGYSTGEYGNANVAWEEATKADVGIELGLYNKVRIQADYFYEKREGIFIQRESTPSVVGTKNGAVGQPRPHEEPGFRHVARIRPQLQQGFQHIGTR